MAPQAQYAQERSVEGAAGSGAHGVQTHTMETVPAEMIVDIIKFDDNRFEKLTGCAGWLVPIG